MGLLAQALAYGPLPVPEAIRRCRQLREEAVRDRGLEAAIATTLAELLAMQGEFAEARALCGRTRALYDQLGLRYLRAVRSFAPAAVELLAGDADAAADELRWAYDTLEAMGERGVRATVAAFLARAQVAAGRHEEGEACSIVSERRRPPTW